MGAKSLQSCSHPTLHNTMGYSPPGSSVLGFSRQEVEKWSGLPYPLSGDLPKTEIKSLFPAVPALKVDSLSLGHQGSPYSNFKETECRKRSFQENYHKFQ